MIARASKALAIEGERADKATQGRHALWEAQAIVQLLDEWLFAETSTEMTHEEHNRLVSAIHAARARLDVAAELVPQYGA